MIKILKKKIFGLYVFFNTNYTFTKLFLSNALWYWLLSSSNDVISAIHQSFKKKTATVTYQNYMLAVLWYFKTHNTQFSYTHTFLQSFNREQMTDVNWPASDVALARSVWLTVSTLAAAGPSPETLWHNPGTIHSLMSHSCTAVQATYYYYYYYNRYYSYFHFTRNTGEIISRLTTSFQEN